MNRAYYSNTISKFCNSDKNEIFGIISKQSSFADEQTQKESWSKQISLLQEILPPYEGSIYFEYSIPRMGKRIDVVLIINSAIYVLEFKVGEKEFISSALDQVWDYALDLKNFHESSHNHFIAPILIATKSQNVNPLIIATPQNDKLLFPIKCNAELLPLVIEQTLKFSDGDIIDAKEWENGRYYPTPTIVEAAMALYNGHSVSEISRSDASAFNLTETSEEVSTIIY